MGEDFFVREVPGIVEKWVYLQITSALPEATSYSVEEEKTLASADAILKQWIALKASALVRHSLPGVEEAVGGAIMILKAMVVGEPRQAKSVTTTSEFHKAIYNKCASFLI